MFGHVLFLGGAGGFLGGLIALAVFTSLYVASRVTIDPDAFLTLSTILFGVQIVFMFLELPMLMLLSSVFLLIMSRLKLRRAP